MLLACDGVFDVMTNREACETLCTLLLEGERDMGNVVEEMLMICLEKDSRYVLVPKLQQHFPDTQHNITEFRNVLCCAQARAPGRRDNMTAVVVAFPAANYGEGEGVAARVREREAREAMEAAAAEAAEAADESEPEPEPDQAAAEAGPPEGVPAEPEPEVDAAAAAAAAAEEAEAAEAEAAAELAAQRLPNNAERLA